MEHRLLTLLILTGFFPLVLSNIHKYYPIKEVKSWMDALVYCRANYTDLATIKTPSEMLQLQTLAKNQLFNSFAWIGLTWDWRWSLNNESLGDDRLWSSTEPWPGDTTPECAVITGPVWVDCPCSDSYPFICYDDRAGVSNPYIMYSTSMTWFDAQSYCRQRHTDLISGKDLFDSSVQKMTSSFTWIGLIRDIVMWSDQPGFDLRRKIDQPNDDKYGNCGGFINGHISASQCVDNYQFICYSEITGQQQILRFKVQSDQDLNNPAVQEALLEKIQQKLKELSVVNITVNFRMQTDTQMFYKLEDNPPVL